MEEKKPGVLTVLRQVTCRCCYDGILTAKTQNTIHVCDEDAYKGWMAGWLDTYRCFKPQDGEENYIYYRRLLPASFSLPVFLSRDLAKHSSFHPMRDVELLVVLLRLLLLFSLIFNTEIEVNSRPLQGEGILNI